MPTYAQEKDVGIHFSFIEMTHKKIKNEIETTHRNSLTFAPSMRSDKCTKQMIKETDTYEILLSK